MKKYSNSKAAALLTASLLGAGLGLQITPTTAFAESQDYNHYVTDSLEIPLRRGPGVDYKIERMVRSGTPIKIIEVNEKGWASVEYQDKKKLWVGWMHSSVLQNQRIARERLREQVKKTNQVEAKYNQLQQELKTLKTRFDETDKELKAVKQERFKLSQEYTQLKSISGNAIKLDEDNQEMKKRLTDLEHRNVIMKEQIDQSQDAIKRQWFLTGGGVLLFGLLLGRFLRMPGGRRKWDSL